MTHAFPPRRSSDLAAREIELAAAIRGEVVHQQHAQALDRPALDLGVATEAERALADVAQRQPCRLGEPGRERNSGRPGASDGIETAFRNRSEEHTSELQSLMRISYAVFCLAKKKNTNTTT